MAIYIDHIMNLIRKSTEDSNCADGVLKASVGLVGDLGHCYTGRMFTLFSQPFIMTILQQANGMEEMGTVTKWTSDVSAALCCTYVYCSNFSMCLDCTTSARWKRSCLVLPSSTDRL